MLEAANAREGIKTTNGQDVGGRATDDRLEAANAREGIKTRPRRTGPTPPARVRSSERPRGH